MFYRIFATSCVALLLMQAPACAQEDLSDFVVRLNNIEQQVRQLTGQVEQLQYENRQLKEQMRGASVPSAPAVIAPPPVAATPPVEPARPAPARRTDVFDPNENPDAPGAPKPLGQTEASRPLTEQERAVGPSVAATGSGDPRTDYDEAYAMFASGKYSEAEMGFRKFLQSHPRDRLVPEAMYWLGETYLSTQRPREAGEQFLAISKQYSSSSKAPSAFLKLGTALTDIGAADRACAIFSEAARKYPKASQSYKDEIARQQRRAKCP